VNWHVPLPKASGPYFPIVSPAPHYPVKGIILSKILVSVKVHYWNKRTAPCTAPGACEGCDIQKMKPRWKGYLAGWMPNAKDDRVLFELTRQSVEYLPFLMESDNLRGLTITLKRKGEARNSPVICELGKPQDLGRPIPAEFDVKNALLRIWEGKPLAGELTDGIGLVDGEV